MELDKTNYTTTKKWECVYKMEGVKLIAETPTQLVNELRLLAFDQPTTNQEHRVRSKVWFKNLDNVDIDITTDRTFVNDLIQYGYVKILQCNVKTLKTN